MYNREALEAEILSAVTSLYTEEKEISTVAAEMGMCALKIRKLLITAGERSGMEYYRSVVATSVQKLRAEGNSIKQIQVQLGLSHASVIGYLPYSKTVYRMRELSEDAARVQRFRERKRLCAAFPSAVKNMNREEEEAYLWETLQKIQEGVFVTFGHGDTGGVKFKYKIDVEEDGGTSDVMTISSSGKSIPRATVLLAYRKAAEMGGLVSDPKKLGVLDAGTYLYSIFKKIGMIKEATMEVKMSNSACTLAGFML